MARSADPNDPDGGAPDDFDEPERSASGKPVFRHEPRDRHQFPPASDNPETIRRLTRHIERRLGPVEAVFHEVGSKLVHVDIHVVAPTPDRPYRTLVTTGMSDRPMAAPPGAEDFRFAELVLSLPPDWPLDDTINDDERHFWPLRWLRGLARFPHEYDTWLGWGHTVPNGDPPRPFSPETALASILLLAPVLTPPAFHQTALHDDKLVTFYGLVPLYPSELEFKLAEGVHALLPLLNDAGVTELLDPQRDPVV